MRFIFLTLSMSLLLVGCNSGFHSEMGYSSSEWHALSDSEKNKLIAKGNHARSKSNIMGQTQSESVTVTFLSGYVKSKSQSNKYKRGDILLLQGECSSVSLVNESSNQLTSVDLCFKNNSVFIDKDYRSMFGYNVRLYKNSMWYRSLKYHGINSKGRAQLLDSDILITLHTKS